MTRSHIPQEDDEDAYIFIDHREEETFIASAISDRLAPEHALEVIEEDDSVSLAYQGQSYTVPLHYSPHDRYIMIASLAHLLREHYRFFLLKPSLDSDTHGLLVAGVGEVNGWPELPDYLVPLDIGYDYFHGIRVPYLGAEDSAPRFAQDRQQVEDSSAAMAGFVEAMLSGKMTDELAEKMASLAAVEVQGRSQAEIAAEIKKSFSEALESPEAIEIRREQEAALANLRSLTDPPPKPWWKLW